MSKKSPQKWRFCQKLIVGSAFICERTGQLPGFQGNVPIGLKALLKDSNMTDNQLGTAWMDSLDPEFAKVADLWMETLVSVRACRLVLSGNATLFASLE